MSYHHLFSPQTVETVTLQWQMPLAVLLGLQPIVRLRNMAA
jgi:hypothetical protein